MTNGYAESEGEKLSYHYEVIVNKKLKTDKYAAASDIDGIILHDIHFETVAYYVKDDIIGEITSFISGKEEKLKEESHKRASKICRILTYVSVPDGVVLKRDSVWGGEPPAKIKWTENGGTGSYPSDKEIADLIEKTIN